MDLAAAGWNTIHGSALGTKTNVLLHDMIQYNTIW